MEKIDPVVDEAIETLEHEDVAPLASPAVREGAACQARRRPPSALIASCSSSGRQQALAPRARPGQRGALPEVPCV